jgi:hypothetical protein
MWQQWLNAIIGLWVIAVPFVGITGTALMWTLAISGAVIAILGIWGAQQEQTLEEELHELQLQHR